MEIEVAEKLADHDARLKVCENREKNLENQYAVLSSMAASMKVMETKLDTTDKTVSEIKSDVTELKQKPGKRMDDIIGYILSALVGGLVTYVLSLVVH